MTWNLNDFEIALKRHSELEAKLATEPDVLVIGNCLAVSTEKLKLGLITELKSKDPFLFRLFCSIAELRDCRWFHWSQATAYQSQSYKK